DFNDHYSMYVPPAQTEAFNQELNQEFGGLGMEIGTDPKTGQLTVLSPIQNSPAAEAGILANDRILAIDGELTKGLSRDEAVKKMRGDVNTSVTLHILRPGSDNQARKEMDVKLCRAKVKVDTVLGDRRASDGSWDFMLEGQDKIGYLRITSFAENTTEELYRAIEQLKEQGMKGLIIDLRDNPGGYLERAVEFCDQFVDEGIIVSTRGRSRDFWEWFKKDQDQNQEGEEEKPKRPAKFHTRDEFWASENGTLDKDFPVAVLINGDSASAAEIVAACLQDYHRAKIVGQRSYGKGTIQEVLPVGGSRGVLKLTSASYWRPSGKNIHRLKDAKEDEDWGVRPDPGFEVPINMNTRKTVVLTRRRRDVHYSDALKIPKELLRAEDEEDAKEGEPKKKGTKTQKRLPLVDPATPMIDVDPQLRKAVEWIKKNEKV
ncbi:MAG: S41 family peptidase, partial [Planctomycetia bacterium]